MDLLIPYTKIGLPVALGLIMLAMGMTLTVADFRRVVARPRAFSTGLCGQMLLPPVLALLFVWAFSLPPALAAGLMILSFCPGGTTSNLFSHLARGDVALSISLTAIASMITPFTIPPLTQLTLQWQFETIEAIRLPVIAAFAKLAVVTLIPVVLGMSWRHFYSITCKRWQPGFYRSAAGLFASVILALIVRDWQLLNQHFGQVGTLSLTMIVVALLLAWGLAAAAGVEHRSRTTIAIEIGMQNGGTALVVTDSLLSNAEMSVVPVMYGLLMLLPIGLLVITTRIRSAQAVSIH